MVKLSGLVSGDREAVCTVLLALDGGAGLEVFRKCIEQQGGDPRVIDDYSRLPTAPRTMQVVAPRSGFVSGMIAGTVGVASMVLGGGRERAEDGIDHAVGVVCRRKPGEQVKAGEAVYEVRYRSTSKLLAALPLLEESFTVADVPPAGQELVLEEIA
jgi:pyrimidine-nucleoside phosphorylase